MSKPERAHPLPIHTQLSSFADELDKRPESHVSTWSPSVDILETKEGYVVTAEVPGMSREDFKITVGSNWISIKGDRKSEAICTQENYHRLECVHGRFHRSFQFPEEIGPQNVTATLAEGVLEIHLTKAAARLQKA